MPVLQQISYLIDLLKYSPQITSLIDFSNSGYVLDTLENITEKQYKLLLALIYNKKWDKLYQVLKDIGLLPLLTWEEEKQTQPKI